ncbi:MAG: MFS transporter [Acidobacteriota bacterium]
MTAQQKLPDGLKTFFILWCGQLVSILGSGLGSFALGVWVFERTGSVMQFSLIAFFAILPGILLAPVAGVVVDRYDRRLVMMVADTCSSVATLVMLALLLSDQLQPWHAYPIVGWMAACAGFQRPAFAASVPLLVAKKNLGRANGMAQMGPALSRIVSPLLAGVLFVTIGLKGVILIDLVSFLLALLTLSLIRIPRPERSAGSEAAKAKFSQELTYGLNFITARKGLLTLLLLFAISNLVFGMVQQLFTPLVLSFASAEVLGRVLTAGAIGGALGSLTLASWGGPRRKIHGIIGFLLLQGSILFLAGLRPTAWMVGLAAFGAMFCTPVITGCSQVIWQRKVPLDVQGRVFALRRMIAWSTLPMAYLFAGPLADYVFEPLMVADGALAGTLGQLIGVGPGRGIALLFIFLGSVLLLAVGVALLFPRLRHVEIEVPDAIPDRDSETGRKANESEAAEPEVQRA